MTSHRMRYKIGLTEYNVAIKDIDASGNGGGNPVGTIIPFASAENYPAGYLLCDGSSVSRTMYPDLFDVIGTSFGSGDGSTTFNLPDLRFVDGDSAKVYGESGKAMQITYPCSSVPASAGGGAINMIYQSGIGLAWELGSSNYGVNIVPEGFDSNVYTDLTSAVSNKVRYLIKAFDGMNTNGALLDLTGMANDLNQRFDMRTDMAIIYPNGGTAAQPANVTKASRYVMANPFPGYRVYCEAELYYNNEWGASGYSYKYTGSNMYAFTSAKQLNDDTIVVIGGMDYVVNTNGIRSGAPFGTTENEITSAPCRVKVWKVGKIPQNP